MSSCFGKNFNISIFGQSHSPAIGVVIDGLPAGFEPDWEKLKTFMSRRAPGKSRLATPRKEGDDFEILSGISDGVLCGAPLCAVIRNTNTRSKDYSQLKRIPRPGHADYTAHVKYKGFQDVAGGGHFSGRLTAPMCFAGGIILQILESKGISIGSHIAACGGISDTLFDPVNVKSEDFPALREKELPLLDHDKEEAIRNAITAAASMRDSVGGIIEVAVTGLPAGIGEPMYDGLEGVISKAVFAVPAIKGIEFGRGFEASSLRGSQNNDGYYMDGASVKTFTNNHGGILGGISSGMPLIFRAAVKPTSSIFIEQQSIDLADSCDTTLSLKGRHDPCIVPRAVPCLEAACAIAIYDSYLDYVKYL